MSASTRGVELRVPPTLDLGSLLAFEGTLESIADAGVVVVVGSADGFCTGLDLQSLGGCADADLERAVHAFTRILLRLRRLPRPTIAVVEGPASGGGVGLAAACDVVLATPAATFALPEALFGLRPAIIEPVLRERVRPAKLRQLVLRGASIVGCAAVDIGLADKIVAPESLQRVVRREVRVLARPSETVVGATKRTDGLADALALGAADTLQRLRSPEVRLRIRRFVDDGEMPWRVTA